MDLKNLSKNELYDMYDDIIAKSLIKIIEFADENNTIYVYHLENKSETDLYFCHMLDMLGAVAGYTVKVFCGKADFFMNYRKHPYQRLKRESEVKNPLTPDYFFTNFLKEYEEELPLHIFAEIYRAYYKIETKEKIKSSLIGVKEEIKAFVKFESRKAKILFKKIDKKMREGDMEYYG